MAQILVRKLEDTILAKIKTRARANGRSTEAEVREILSAAVASGGGKHKSLVSLIGAGRSSRSQAEINAYVRNLRREWEH